MLRLSLAVARSWPNGQVWTETSPKIRDWVLQEHDSRINGARFGTILNSEAHRGIAADGHLQRGALGQLALTAARDIDETFTLARLAQQMTDLGRGDRIFGKVGDVISPMYLRRILQVAGWRDVGGADEVLMERG